MSSDALLGSRPRPPGPSSLSKDRFCQVLRAVRHWWTVTTSRDYFRSRKWRLVLKAVILFTSAVYACLDIPFAASHSVAWILCVDVLLPMVLLVLIRHDSIWLDVYLGAWFCLDLWRVSATDINNDRLGFAWTWASLFYMQVGGLHSICLVPCLCITFLAMMSVAVADDASWFDGGSDTASANFYYSVLQSAMGGTLVLVTEWQGASGFQMQQKSTQMKQLLLDQATDGQCTLSWESGTVRDPSSALLENLGPDAEGQSIFEFISPGDWPKVDSMLRGRGDLPPSPILVSFLRRPAPAGAPTAQFEAKLVPYAVADGGSIHACLHKVGEERLPEQQAGRARGSSAQGEDVAGPMRQAAACLGAHAGPENPARAQGAPPEHDLEAGTEISFDLSQSYAADLSQKPSTKSVSVQAKPRDLLSARPPLLPGPLQLQQLALPKHRKRRQKEAKQRPWARLNTSKRQLPAFAETPLASRVDCLMDAMVYLNVCGDGCCQLHISVAAAKRALDAIGKRGCCDMAFGERQCPECLIVFDKYREDEHVDSVVCECCGRAMCPLKPGSSNLGTSGDVAPTSSRCGDASQHSISIDRSGGDKIGLTIHPEESSLLVTSVDGGLAEQWNMSHVGAEVRAGDRLIEINGIRGDSQQLVSLCGQNTALEIIVSRSSEGAIPETPHDVMFLR